MEVKNNLFQSQLLQSRLQQNSNTTPLQETSNNVQEGESTFSPEEEKEKVKEVTEGMNEFLKPVHTSLKFEFHDKLEEYYVTIVDENTDEVIREIPPKKMLDMYASIAESLGFIVDHKI